MNEIYFYEVNEEGDIYSFTSIGTKGEVEKIVRFEKLGENYFNLAMGDVKSNGKLDFENDSGNDDMIKVVATVGDILKHFCESRSGAIIYISGSDNRRTKIYQWRLKRAMAAEEGFMFMGVNDSGEFESFRNSESYAAFLVVRVG